MRTAREDSGQDKLIRIYVNDVEILITECHSGRVVVELETVHKMVDVRIGFNPITKKWEPLEAISNYEDYNPSRKKNVIRHARKCRF